MQSALQVQEAIDTKKLDLRMCNGVPAFFKSHATKLAGLEVRMLGGTPQAQRTAYTTHHTCHQHHTTHHILRNTHHTSPTTPSHATPHALTSRPHTTPYTFTAFHHVTPLTFLPHYNNTNTQQVLDMSFSGIKRVPPEVWQLTSLTYLDTRGCPLLYAAQH